MLVVPEGTEDFDEGRFNALLELAGPSTARTLATRLDEDLTLISRSLTQPAVLADRQLLRAQSHMLLGIAGTIGANRLYQLTAHLNSLPQAHDSGLIADLLGEIHALLDRLILRIRSTRAHMSAKP